MNNITWRVTMLQQGRGGIYRYVAELARAIAEIAPKRAPVMDMYQQDRPLLPDYASISRNRWPSLLGHPVIDIIRTQGAGAGSEILHVPSYRRVPLWHRAQSLVATVHDLAPLHMPEKYGWARYQFIKRLVPQTLRRCDHICTVTEHTKNDLIEQMGIDAERITTTYPGIDHMKFCPGEQSCAWQRLQAWQPQLSTSFVCYTSRIEHPGKGHMQLLRAWRILMDQGHDLPQLVFVGSPCERADEVLKFAEQQGIPVLVTGFVPEELLADVYRACELFVFPSCYEGFGLPPVEAMACGAVVASSRAAALSETAGPSAELQPDSPEQMADQIVTLLTDSQRRQALRDAGMKWARQFTWQRCARQTLSVYDLLSQSQPITSESAPNEQIRPQIGSLVKE